MLHELDIFKYSKDSINQMYVRVPTFVGCGGIRFNLLQSENTICIELQTGLTHFQRNLICHCYSLTWYVNQPNEANQ